MVLANPASIGKAVEPNSSGAEAFRRRQCERRNVHEHFVREHEELHVPKLWRCPSERTLIQTEFNNLNEDSPLRDPVARTESSL